MPKKSTRRPKNAHQPSPIISWSLICFTASLLVIAAFMGLNGLAG